MGYLELSRILTPAFDIRRRIEIELVAAGHRKTIALTCNKSLNLRKVLYFQYKT